MHRDYRGFKATWARGFLRRTFFQSKSTAGIVVLGQKLSPPSNRDADEITHFLQCYALKRCSLQQTLFNHKTPNATVFPHRYSTHSRTGYWTRLPVSTTCIALPLNGLVMHHAKVSFARGSELRAVE